MPALLGQQRCPHCSERFRALKPGAATRRDCKCGKRWTIHFELVENDLTERLGQETYRLRIEPYVDGRKRRADPAAPQLFDDELNVPSDEETPTKRRRVAVKRGTHYRR